ncbi:MAG: hypothetical protein V3T43_06130 [Nitrosomonadaceae bacterium]
MAALSKHEFLIGAFLITIITTLVVFIPSAGRQEQNVNVDVNTGDQTETHEKIINTGSFISGEYGTKCYNEGEEHGGIKYPVKFDTLEECLEYVSNN